MATWSTKYVNDLPDSAFACPDERKYPHHNKSGDVDLPHLRNALSRVAQADTETCGVQHLRAHAKKLGIGEDAEKRATFARVSTVAKADEARQIAYSVVLEPCTAETTIDTQGDYYDAEDIELAAHGFLASVAKGIGGSGVMHLGAELVGYPVESFIAPVDFVLGDDVVKAGSWVVGMHYPDPAIWADVVKGKYAALSVQGRGVRIFEEVPA
jgi:hypothetical protein